jgi:2-oxoisovalerate dehydrogenase E1 component alpha subunit
MPTIRVDGNDIFAIYFATKKAREIIIAEKRPVLIEAITYRVGDHSTSDFSATYRGEEEMKKWTEHLEKFSNPIHRLEKYLLKKGIITPDINEKLRLDAKMSVRDSLKAANALPKPTID